MVPFNAHHSNMGSVPLRPYQPKVRYTLSYLLSLLIPRFLQGTPSVHLSESCGEHGNLFLLEHDNEIINGPEAGEDGLGDVV